MQKQSLNLAFKNAIFRRGAGDCVAHNRQEFHETTVYKLVSQ